MLVALPVLVFAIPALLGHPVLAGDDQTQNFPLRVLAGREIRAGHLPLFDAYDWSGSPLLAGWNAGAAYPLTWLFAVLPAAAAWTAGLIVTYVTAGVGMFGFLRKLRLKPIPAFLGALSFALAGAMSAQVPHFGLVAGMSWVPLALLAILSLTGRPCSPATGDSWVSRQDLRWIAVLAVTVALIVLAGEPRAIVDGFIVIGCYAVWQVGRLWFSGQHGRGALAAAALIAGGCLLGVCLSAVQWLPGLSSIAGSQRGTGSLALFSSGSLPPEWLLMTLVPDILGGFGTLSEPSFFANYSLTEVTSYVGILPLVAAFALGVRALAGRFRTEYLIWHVMGIVGVALALGGETPLGQVLYRLPLYGGQRLQSRNILLLDLALAILLAYWLDDPFPKAARRRRAIAETLAGVLPPLGVLGLAVLSLTWGAGLLRWIGTGPARAADGIGPLRPWLLPSVVLAVAAIALVVAGRRLGPRWWARACAGFVAVDIVVFTVLAVIRVAPAPVPAPAPSSGSGSSAASSSPTAAPAAASPAVSSPARPVSALGYSGRFAIYDPDQLDGADLSALGPPDVNVLAGDSAPSVQGYSSIVDGAYASATGSHSATGEGQNVLSPAAVGDGTLDALGTSDLLTLPSYLTTTAGQRTPAPGPPGTGRRGIQAGQSATWYLGESVAVARISVPDSDARADAARGTRIGFMAPDGKTTSWYPARAASATSLEISLPRTMTATAVLMRAGSGAGAPPVTAGAPSVTLAGGRVLTADGQLQNGLTAPRWSMAGTDGGFAVFTDRLAAAPVTAAPLPPASGASGRVSVRYTTRVPGDATSAAISSAHGARVVRSMASIPGWTATWQPAGGRPVTTLTVRSDGVVQAVDVPPGQGTVTWHYMTPRFRTGLAVSVAAAGCLAALLAIGPLRREKLRDRSAPPRRELQLARR